MENKGFIQFEIINNVLVNTSWFIWIPMLYVYGHYKYFDFYSEGINFWRQILTILSKIDSRAVRVKALRTTIVVLNLFY